MRSIDRFPPATIRDDEDRGRNPTDNEPFCAILGRHLDRRALLKGSAMAALGALAPFGKAWAQGSPDADDNDQYGPSSLRFRDVRAGIDSDSHLANGHRDQVLLRWGDPLFPDLPEWDPNNLTAETQARQFGYNCDFIAYFSLPYGATNSAHGLLCVNHEYTSPELMFSQVRASNVKQRMNAERVAVEMAAHGVSVAEVRLREKSWAVELESVSNRRITATTPITISGPAAGHPRLATAADPTGAAVLGTINNCGGGVTPWDTVLICEENFNHYFHGAAAGSPEAAAHARYGVGGESPFAWHLHDGRFDLAQAPNEANRFGWVVEFDPYDPTLAPVKRTALGRFKHEGAGVVRNLDGRIVVYMGDDERFEYIYRFVSARAFDPENRAANWGLLDDGVLSVARFADDGSLIWLPLIYGAGPLTSANGFNSQADVLIEARRAADLLGATPMDRPEDIEADPKTGRVFAALTFNEKRTADDIDGPNPRPRNDAGHVIELLPPGEDGARDHAADAFQWSIFLLAGRLLDDRAEYGPGTEPTGWLACPDNLAFDPAGHLWIATDQGSRQKEFGFGDGLYGCDIEGPGRAVMKRLFRAPRGAEVSGPCFTPDGSTLFLSIQHPGEGSTFDRPYTHWPDFIDRVPPRPSVIAIIKENETPIGS